MAKKTSKPRYDDSDDDVELYLQQNQASESSDDDLSTLSFGHLKSAQQQMDEEEGKFKAQKPKKAKRDNQKILDAKNALKEEMKKAMMHNKVKSRDEVESPDEFGQYHSDVSEGMFEEEDQDSDNERPLARSSKGSNKKRSKHAPSEQSAKKRVPKIRTIPGLEKPNESSLYKDIRFDTAFGKADLNRVRKDYKFLDDYRQQEVQEIDRMLKDPKMRNKLAGYEINELEYQSKSLRSRLDTLKNRDLQQDVLKKYKEEHNIKGKFFLKKSDQRKIVQKHKFENMKSKQREKVVERKRKRKLGKEFKQLEFNRGGDR